MDDLTHEIRLLRLLVVASVLFSLSLGGALIWLMATRNRADHLAVHRLQVIDAGGQERIRLYAEDSGDARVEILDKDGKVTYRLGD